MTALFEARGVTKRFGGLTAVNRVDFALEQGHRVASSAPTAPARPRSSTSSPGSTCPTRATSPFRGQLAPAGCARTRSPRSAICRTFQNIRLFANMTALENVLVGMHARDPARLWDVLARTPALPPVERGTWSARLELLDAWSASGPRRTRSPEPALRRPAAAGDRARAGLEPTPAAPRRADRRDDPGRGAAPHGAPPPARRRAAAHDPPHRAQHARGHGRLRSRDGARPRREDRRGPAAEVQARPAGHRGVPRAEGRWGARREAPVLDDRGSPRRTTARSTRSRASSLEVEQRRDRRPARQQRRRQDHDAQDASRGCSRPRRGRITLEGRPLAGVPPHEIVRARRRARPRGTPDLQPAHRAREPRDGRLPAKRRRHRRPTSTASSRSSRACGSARRRWRARSRAASSRCSPSGAR